MVLSIDHPSPNHDARPSGLPVDILLLHYTGMADGQTALDRLCDPAAKVSAHYCIDEDGSVLRLVPEDRRAWHAGASSWAGDADINGRSIGIELVNPGHEFGYRPFTDLQMTALIDLATGVLDRHPIPPHRVLGHSDVAPLRKEDPGELFDWPALAAADIGLWPETPAPLGALPSEAQVKAALARFGYGYLDEDFPAVVRAFQRRFRPEALSGEVDGETAARLFALLARLDGGSGGT
jgi:N-acetylmuramoyl-L-alanine amidase